MAKRKYDKRFGSMAGATQRMLNIAFPPEPHNVQFAYIQIDRLLSGVNHRLYRQGMCYRVTIRANGIGVDPNKLEIFTIQNTWMFRKAYAMARAMYNKSQADEKAAGIKPSRWLDFRVKPSDAGVGNQNCTAVRFSRSGTTSACGNDEYQMSSVHLKNDTEREFHVEGASTSSSWGIIAEYDRQADTETEDGSIAPAALPYYDLFDDLQYQEAGTMIADANEPPYDADRLKSDQVWVKQGVLQATSGGSYRDTVTVDAPLGLILVRNVAVDHLLQSGYKLDVECHPGDYKGVHATNLLQTGA
jgi:hypothetical protein